MESPADRLRYARSARGFESAAAAAAAAGWNDNTYRQHENGTRGFSRLLAARYGKFFGVSPGWLLTGEEPLKLRGVPVAGRIAAAAVVPATDDLRGLLTVPAPPGCPEDAVAYLVDDDENWPAYRRRDVVVTAGAETDPARIAAELLGRDCIVTLADGRMLFRRIEAGKRPGTFTLEGYGAGAAPIRDAMLLRAEPMLWLRRDRV